MKKTMKAAAPREITAIAAELAKALEAQRDAHGKAESALRIDDAANKLVRQLKRELSRAAVGKGIRR